MQIVFIKTSHAEYTLRCTREDGSVTEITLNARSYLKHDIVHFVLEKEAGLTESFFGIVAGGRELDALTPAAMKGEPEMSREIQTTEMIVGALQGALQKSVVESDFTAHMVEYLKLHNITPPLYLTQEFIQNVFDKILTILAKYRDIKTGQQLDFSF